jgi:hypothetical protein
MPPTIVLESCATRTAIAQAISVLRQALHTA